MLEHFCIVIPSESEPPCGQLAERDPEDDGCPNAASGNFNDDLVTPACSDENLVS
jgi:hypothetical protein